jgi:hypothetical protein
MVDRYWVDSLRMGWLVGLGVCLVDFYWVVCLWVGWLIGGLAGWIGCIRLFDGYWVACL